MKTDRTIASSAILGVDLLDTARQIGPQLSTYVTEEESNRRLSRQTIGILREAGFYRLFTPTSLGGLEVDPLTTASVIEEVARHNAAAAWSMMVANTSAWWCSRLTERGIDAVFGNGPDVFLAGAFHPPMKATPVEGGYRINGRSPLSSNVHEAKWIFVTALVMKGNNVSMIDGRPEIIGVMMDAAHCEILDTWHTVGMRATDSNDIKAEDVFVPSHLSYPLVPAFEPNVHYRAPLYHYPAIAAGIGCLIVPVALAVARNAIRELKALAEKKVPFGSSVSIRERGTVQRKLGMAEAMVQSADAYLDRTLSSCWQMTLAGEPISLEDRATLLLAIAHANQSCFQAVELMYSAAGTSAVYTQNPLARYFCDAQVIRHHGFANESRYETAAQVYLGLPPDLPVIMF